MSALVVINAVGLTSRLLSSAPRLQQLAQTGWCVALQEVLPAVTCTAQATMLTGVMPSEHGIVGNGWLFRDTMEVRFWQQSNRLIQAEPIYQTMRRESARRGKSFRCAKLFWWYNQGADVAISVTPKPYYGSDGNKVFGITGTPPGQTEQLEQRLGPFPFHTFWGPLAGLPSTDWIGRCAAVILEEERPDLSLVYMPHLDYEPQRVGTENCDWPKLVGELDQACASILDAAKKVGARVWVISEYGHCTVGRAVELNRILRQAKLLMVRPGPFGETLDTFGSRAFAVCDHQLAHVYVKDQADATRVKELVEGLPGVARVVGGKDRSELKLAHERSGELIALAEKDAWFAYPFWLDDRQAPDYARTVNIHAKPGYDACELFFDPKLRFPKLRAAFRLFQKKLGFRMLMDVVPLDAGLVRGSHGLMAENPDDRPVFIGDGARPEGNEPYPMTVVHRELLNALRD